MELVLIQQELKSVKEELAAIREHITNSKTTNAETGILNKPSDGAGIDGTSDTANISHTKDKGETIKLSVWDVDDASDTTVDTSPTYTIPGVIPQQKPNDIILIHELEKMVKITSAKLEHVETFCLVSKAKIDALESKSKLLECQLKMTTGHVNQLQDRLEKVNLEKVVLSTRQEATESQFMEKHKQLQDKISELETTTNNNVQKLSEKLESATVALSSINNQICQLENSFETIESSVELLSQRKSHAEEKVGIESQLLQQMQQKVEHLTESSDSVKDNLGKEISQVKLQVQELQQQESNTKAQLKKQMTALNRSISLTKEEREKVNEQLWKACREGDIKSIKAALQQGAQTEQKRCYIITSHLPCLLTSLHVAAINDHPEATNLLLNEGADVDAVAGKKQWTALMIASEYNHPQVVKLLLDHGASVNMKENSNGFTALHYAAEEANLSCVQLLVVVGKADVNVRDYKGMTPLARAEEKNGGKDPVIKYLKENGATK